MTPKNVLEYQKIEFIFDSEPVIKVDESGDNVQPMSQVCYRVPLYFLKAF